VKQEGVSARALDDALAGSRSERVPQTRRNEPVRIAVFELANPNLGELALAASNDSRS
jgi:hypothetical protein